MLLTTMLAMAAPPVVTAADQVLSTTPMRVVAHDARFTSIHGDDVVMLEAPNLSFWRIQDEHRDGLLTVDSQGRASARLNTPDGHHDTFIGKTTHGRITLEFVESKTLVVPADAPVFCGVQAPPRPLTLPARTGGAHAAGPRTARIAIDADQAYIDRYNGDEEATLAGITALIAEVSAIYERDLGIRLELAFVRLWPDGNEPWDVSALSSFRQWWLSNEDHEAYHFVHLLSGRRDTPFGGIAYIATACNQGAFGISAYQLGGFPPQPGPPSLDIWDINVVAHEIGHNLGTLHTHDGYEPTIDECGNGITAPRGTIMSYCHIHQGGLLNIDLRMHARVQDLVIELNPPGDCLPHDCNANGADDAIDILNGTSADSDGDGIPDECRDCNNNGQVDTLDIASGLSSDVDGDAIPDECMPDCNQNGIPDTWDIDSFGIEDANGNLIPDGCEADCNANMIMDFAEIAAEPALDLDRDGLLDACWDCGSAAGPEWLASGGTGNFVVVGNEFVREYHARSGVLVATYSGLTADPLAVTVVDAPATGPTPVIPLGTVLIAQSDGDVFMVTPGTTEAVTLGLNTELIEPIGMVVTPDRRLLVSDASANLIQAFDLDTLMDLGTFVGGGPFGVTDPRKMVIRDMQLLVACNTSEIRSFDLATGMFEGVVVSHEPFGGVSGLAVLENGDIIASSPTRDMVWRFDGQTGESLDSFTDEYGVTAPTDITPIDADRILVVKAGEPARIVEYDNRGRYRRSMIRGDYELTTPLDVSIKVASRLDCNGNAIPDDCELEAGDSNGDGILDTCQCIADINGDGAVGVSDLLLVIGDWGQMTSQADIDGSGTVDATDLLLVLEAWGNCEPPPLS